MRKQKRNNWGQLEYCNTGRAGEILEQVDQIGSRCPIHEELKARLGRALSNLILFKMSLTATEGLH